MFLLFQLFAVTKNRPASTNRLKRLKEDFKKCKNFGDYNRLFKKAGEDYLKAEMPEFITDRKL